MSGSGGTPFINQNVTVTSPISSGNVAVDVASISSTDEFPTEISTPNTAFNEVQVAQLFPKISGKFSYNVNSELFKDNSTGAGALTDFVIFRQELLYHPQVKLHRFLYWNILRLQEDY
jgi:hypothetical protein